jgi:hypothetical protein
MKGMDEKLFHLQEIEAGVDDLRRTLGEIQGDLNRIPFETTLAALLEEMKGLHEEMKALRKGIRRAMEQRDAAAVESDSLQTQQETIIRAQNEAVLRAWALLDAMSSGRARFTREQCLAVQTGRADVCIEHSSIFQKGESCSACSSKKVKAADAG